MNFKYKVLFFFIPMMIFSQNRERIELGEAVVTSKKNDSIVIKLDSITKKGNIAELIKDLPGFFIDNDKIFFKGKEIKKMTIDQKEMYSGNTKITSEQIPSDWVDQLKISGMNNSDDSPNIELTLKDGKKNAISTTLEALVSDRYRYYGSLTKVNKSSVFNLFIDRNNIQKNILPNDFIYPEVFNSIFFPKKDLVSQIMYSPNNFNNISLEELNIGDYKQWQFGSNFTLKKNNFDYSLFLIGNLPSGNLSESRLMSKENIDNKIRQTKDFNEAFDKRYINVTQKFNFRKDKLNINFFNQLNFKKNEIQNETLSDELLDFTDTSINNTYRSKLSLEEKNQIIYNKFFVDYKLNRLVNLQAGGELNFKNTISNSLYNNQFNESNNFDGQQRRDLRQLEYLYFLTNATRIGKRMQLQTRYSDYFEYSSFDNENVVNGNMNNVLHNYSITNQQRNVEAFLWYVRKKLDIVVGVDYVNLYYRNNEETKKRANYIFPKILINYKSKKDFQYRLMSVINKTVPNVEQLLPIEDRTNIEDYWLGNNSINPIVFTYDSSISMSKTTNNVSFTFTISHSYIPKIWTYNNDFTNIIPKKEYFLYDNSVNNFSTSLNLSYMNKKKTFSLFNLLIYRSLNSFIIINDVESKLRLNSINNVTHLSYKLKKFSIGLKNNARLDIQERLNWTNINRLTFKLDLFKSWFTELELENRINHSETTQIMNPIINFNSKKNFKNFNLSAGIYNLLNEKQIINNSTTRDHFINSYRQNRIGRYFYVTLGVTI